jgi:eukaryotic-like serine/threonine-protein kinase
MADVKAGCPGDETYTRLVEGLLSEDEVRDLEAHCDGCIICARLMAELARSISPSGGGLLDDRYRLLEPLGAGGMGVVYAAFDTKLGRKVAIKRLRETGTGTPAEKRRGRFMREAQLLASLSHPNVLTIHDVGGADRELYVVMELVDGAPVSRWRAEKRPGWRRIVDVYLQAGRGLVAAHQLGIVHRDIKPDNILVANNGRVLVGDFGLAGLAGSLTPAGDSPHAPLRSPPPASGSLTQTGAVLGTPAYMSPEQHDG